MRFSFDPDLIGMFAPTVSKSRVTLDFITPLFYNRFTMRSDVYLKLQKKFGGKWVATNQNGHLVYAQARDVDRLFENLKKKNITPDKTVIGFIEKYGQVSAYFSLSIQKN